MLETNLTSKKILLLGYGDLARRTALHFNDLGCTITAVARSSKDVPQGVDLWQGSIADFVGHAERDVLSCDVVVITLTPGGRRESDYVSAYLDNMRLLLDAWARVGVRPGCVIFVSSTSVYGQDNGERVDEESDTHPEKDTAKVLLKTEALLQASNIPSCSLRFAGIYGPGRHFLIRQVAEGNMGGPAYTNRIHAEDCAGIIAFLIKRFWADKYLPPVLLASDGVPVISRVVRQSIAETLQSLDPDFNIPEIASVANVEGSKRIQGMNKRCDNSKLIHLGYRFRYPSYKEGFPELIREFLNAND